MRDNIMAVAKSQPCRFCQSLDVNEVLVLPGAPLAAQWLPTQEELIDDETITLCVTECSNCGLIQLANQPVYYYRDVITAQSLSEGALGRLTNEFDEKVFSRYPEVSSVCEVGCGRGDFVKLLLRLGYDGEGIENNADYVNYARSQGLRVHGGYISEEVDLAKFGTYDLVVANNFLEHQVDIKKFLQNARLLIKDGGLFYCSVPSFERMLELDCVHEFIRDHLSYFTERNLALVLHMSGFSVEQAYKKNNDNDLVVIARKRQPSDLSKMLHKLESLVSTFDRVIDELQVEQRVIAIWGAGHRALTFISQSQHHKKLSCVIDSAEFKQGRYTPVTHLPILSFDEALDLGVDAIICMLPGEINEEVATTVRSSNRFFGRTFMFDDKDIVEI